MTEYMTSGIRWPVLIASVISAIWLGLCAYYVHAEVGWSSFIRFRPHELGAVIAGIFAPLACLWLVVSLVRRQTDLNRGEEMAQAVQSATQRSEALGQSAGGTMETVRRVGAELEHQSRELKDNYASARNITDLSESLTDEPSPRDDAPNVAKERGASIGRVFMEQAESNSRASDYELKKIPSDDHGIKTNIDKLQTALIKASVQATEMSKAFEAQAEIPSKAAKTQADQVCSSAFDARRDMFLRASKFVIEDLNSTAIDLNRFLNSDRTDKLCPKFAKGDTRFFVHGVLSEDEKKARQVIHQKYEHDDKFRKLVSRYIDHFEKLLTEAKESDPENLLSSTFLSADVGKLYMLLARTVGRLN